jgi:hypothetical protein
MRFDNKLGRRKPQDSVIMGGVIAMLTGWLRCYRSARPPMLSAFAGLDPASVVLGRTRGLYPER